ncbi:MAG: NAD(P)/FAD-dependent oxidoreductase [Methanomassiliicoccales archaeon]|jgi:digeranylgeranylglycerophospholipid reductase|nr:NAD(P)/FAD-dependent oxidoreductase [Methanomassiliicoccales archaeon]
MITGKYDVIVVGAGPAGSMTAKHAAQNGASVLMIEKRQEIGSPVRCGEGISRASLDEVGIRPDRKWIAAEVDGAKIVSPSGHTFTINERMAGNEVGMVLERVLFDKALAADAAKSGAEIRVKTSAVGLKFENGKVRGVKVISQGEPMEFEAGCVVGADGFESQIGRWGGLDTTLKPNDITSCFQYRLTNIDHDFRYCEFIIGSVAPGGYIWIFPKDEHTANVGIGVLLSKIKAPGQVKQLLDRFIAKDERLNKGQPLDAVSGAVSVSPPPDKLVRDGLLLVGDAARIIDPITGGGIAHACISGMLAGKVLGEAAQDGDFSEAKLMKYENMLRDRLENKLWRNWMAKEKLITLSDETFDKIIQTLAEVGVEKMSVGNILKVIKSRHPELVKEFEDLI